MATSFVEEVVDYAQAGGIGTRGTSLFVNQLPDEDTDDVMVVLQEFPGGQMPYESQAPIINLAWTSRAESYDIARAKMAEIANYFHARTTVILEHSRVLVFTCNTAGSIGQDTRNRELCRMMMTAKAHAYVADSEGEDDGGGGGDEGTGDSGDSGGGGKDPNPGDIDP